MAASRQATKITKLLGDPGKAIAENRAGFVGLNWSNAAHDPGAQATLRSDWDRTAKPSARPSSVSMSTKLWQPWLP